MNSFKIISVCTKAVASVGFVIHIAGADTSHFRPQQTDVAATLQKCRSQDRPPPEKSLILAKIGGDYGA